MLIAIPMQQKLSTLQFWGAIIVLLVGVAVRLPLLNQSLWYDEMTTLAEYVLQPWSKVLAAGAGNYVPNNHVLHTIIAKLIYSAATKVPDEVMLRLPALLAGLLVPLALAWPMHRSAPLLAFTLALVTSFNPWLVDFSTEARGYSLLLLLGILATHCLMNRKIAYVIFLTLAIYTVPLAVLLIPAHGIAILVLDRSAFKRWIGQIAVVVTLAALLYLPMARGLASYYRHPYPATISFREFLNALPRFALAGVNSTAAIFWAMPVIAIAMGSVLGWARETLRPSLITFAVATVLGILLPLVIPGAAEVRFVPWILPWFCLAVVAALFAAPNRWAKIVAVCGCVALISFEVIQDMRMLPNQPVREAMQMANSIAPPNSDIMMLYLGARESIAVYGAKTTHHKFLAAPDVQSMDAMQLKSLQETGHLPWVILFYEKLAFERNHTDPLARGLWTHLVTHYHLITKPPLPGRVSSVAIYAPN